MNVNLADISVWMLRKRKFEKEGILLWQDSSATNKAKVRSSFEKHRSEFSDNDDSDEDGDDSSRLAASIATVNAKLTHNILAFWHNDVNQWQNLDTPLGIAILERASVDLAAQTPHLPYPFTISFPNGDAMKFSAFSEEDREEWTQKLSQSNREILQLQVDALSEKIMSSSSEESEKASPTVDEQSSSAIFTEWTKKSFEFVTQKQQACYSQERMVESKLSIVLPLQLLKLYISDSESLCDQLESSLTYLPSNWNSVRFATIRHLSNNVDKYKRCANFLEGFSVNGPFFKQSIRKTLDSFAFAPTNLHLQRFMVFEQETEEKSSEWRSYNFLTSGACSAIPCNFTDGGSQKIRKKILKLIGDQEAIDGCSDSRFWARRASLQDVKQRVLCLRKEVTSIFEPTSNYNPAKAESFMQKIKDLLCLMSDFVAGFPKLKESFDCLSEFMSAESEKIPEKEVQLPNGRIRRKSRLIPEAYDSQKSDILALDVSLITKISTLNDVKDGTSSSQSDLALWVQDAYSVAVKLVEAIAVFSKSLNDAHLFRLLVSLNTGGPQVLGIHYGLQFRRDVILSQALSIVCTGILSKFWLDYGAEDKHKIMDACAEWPLVPLIFNISSYLSCYGDEKGMLEDTIDVWHLVRNMCHFRFVRAFSSLKSPSCMPVVEGNRSEMTLNLPLPESVFNHLPQSMRAGERFSVFPILWNVGINQEAMMARTFGDCSLERMLMAESADDLRAYLTMLNSKEDSSALAHAEFLSSEIESIVEKKSHSPDVNTKILKCATEITRTLGGINVICCKSGKDRTAMAVTLEEGRILRETKGFLENEVVDAVARLRIEGTRRVNCCKNIGLPMYAFNSIQCQILPKAYRPPHATFSSSTQT